THGTVHCRICSASAGNSASRGSLPLTSSTYATIAAYVDAGSVPAPVGGIVVRVFSKRSATDLPLHCCWKYGPASGVPYVPLTSVVPWQTAHAASYAVLPARTCAAVNGGGAVLALRGDGRSVLA